MAYTNVWDDATPTGAEAANTIDDIFRSLKVDIEQRFIDIFAMPNFTADPLRPYGLKFTDAQDAVISLGDNTGTPRNLIVKNKAGVTTYLTIGSTITAAVQTDINALFRVTLTTQQATLRYDISNRLDFTIGSTGIITYAAIGASGAHNFTGGGLSIPAATKLWLDGGGAGDTYITETSANNIAFFAGGSAGLQVGSVAASFGSTIDVDIAPTKRFYLDGGGDTYIYESAANIFRLYVGGVNVLAADAGTINMSGAPTSVIIASGAKFYIDSGFDTYLWESSANHITGVAGGVTAFDVTTTTFTLNTGLDLVVQPTKKLFLDGGGNTYLQEASADTLVVVVGGVALATWTTLLTLNSNLDVSGGLSIGAAAVPSHGIAFGNSAPSVLANGQIWFDGTDFKARQGGTTKTITLT